jgi:hypothetical protein
MYSTKHTAKAVTAACFGTVNTAQSSELTVKAFEINICKYIKMHVIGALDQSTPLKHAATAHMAPSLLFKAVSSLLESKANAVKDMQTYSLK